MGGALRRPPSHSGPAPAGVVRYAAGIGRPRPTSAELERHLGTRGTARHRNTVLKPAALANA